MSTQAPALTGGNSPTLADTGVTVLVLVLAMGAGVLVALSGAEPASVAFACAITLVIIIAMAPAVGAFAWLLAGPLIVGIPRGDGIMVLRPNEGLLLVAIAGIGLRMLWHVSRGERFLPRIQPVDIAVALLTVAGTIIPLLLRYGRGLPLSQDDLLYAMVFVKYFMLYLLFRFSISTEKQVWTCLKLALVAGSLVAVVALLQVGGLFRVPELLAQYYDSPFEGSEGPSALRASSTVASSFGLADMMTICLAIILAWQGAARSHYLLLVPAGVLFLGACFAAGSFSGVLGLTIVVVTVGMMTRRLLFQLSVLVPTVILAVAAIWPVVATRLEGFQSYQGLPRSWLGRLENLERFFWPDVFSGFNWILGVRPAARVAAPEMWRQWVYIESGHTWLLWTGGLPLFLAFLYLSWVLFRDLYAVAVRGHGPVAIAAAAGFASTMMIFILMLFDPHLTVRGTADLFFPLIALAVASGALESPASGAVSASMQADVSFRSGA